MKTINFIDIKNLPILGLMIALLTGCGEPLPESGNEESTVSSEPKVYSVEEALKKVAFENDVSRTLYTKAIVGQGKKQGFKFDEDWMKDDVEAGPLPALFLRGISSDIRKSSVPLGLYLGSDFPINSANKFTGKQADLFQEIRADEKPKFFYDESAKLHTAMFPDFAAAAPCVTCHNEHPETSKTDWELGDVMGATTWQYPSDSLTEKEMAAVIDAYRAGVVATFNAYLEEIAAFKTSEKPEIGTTWPKDGKYLPTAEVFLDSVKAIIETSETETADSKDDDSLGKMAAKL